MRQSLTIAGEICIYTNQQIVVESLGGDTQVVEVSAKTRAGLDNLYGPAEAAIDVTRWA